MTPENFVYWLQGFLEMSDVKSLDEAQTKMLRDHIALVFQKVTPASVIAGSVGSTVNIPILSKPYHCPTDGSVTVTTCGGIAGGQTGPISYC